MIALTEKSVNGSSFILPDASRQTTTPPATIRIIADLYSKAYRYSAPSPEDAIFYGDMGDIAQLLLLLGESPRLVREWLPAHLQFVADNAPAMPSKYQRSTHGNDVDWYQMLADLRSPLMAMGVKVPEESMVETLDLLAKACPDDAEFVKTTTNIKPLAMPQQFKDWANVIKPFQRTLSNRLWEERKSGGGDRAGGSLSGDQKYEKFISELKVIRQEENPAKRQFLLAELAQKQSKSLSTIRSILADLDISSAAPEKQDWDLDELLALADESLSWLIPGFIPRGELLLLSAAPKVGKTLLVSQIALSVLTGGEVLQTQCQQGKVLYVTSDESMKSVARRVKGTGFDLLEQSLRPNFKVHTGFDICNQAPLQERLNTFKPDLVIFDSLTSISRRLGVSENDPEFARPIYQLRDLLATVDASGILIHHDNKSKEARGMEKMSGSLRIAAAAWGHWQLTRDIQDPDRRLLSITPREMEPSQHRLAINPKPEWDKHGIYRYESEVGDESGEKRSQAQKILDLLSNGDRLTAQEISAQVYCSNIYTVLNRLEGQISSDYDANKRKVYFIPRTDNSGTDFSPTPPPVTITPKNCYSTPQTQTEKEIQPTNIEPNILLTSQLTNQLTSPDFEVGGGESTTIEPVPVPQTKTEETTVTELVIDQPEQTIETDQSVNLDTLPETAIAIEPANVTQKIVESETTNQPETIKPGDLVVEVTRPDLVLTVVSIDDDGEWARCRDLEWGKSELCLMEDLRHAQNQ